MKRLLITFSLLTILTISSVSQDNIDVENEIRLIHNIYYSDSSEIFFDLNRIPKELIQKMQELASSINKEKPTINFIANRNEEWRATDFEPNKSKNSPTRMFLFGITKNDSLVLLYWHGGRGKHIHLVMFAKGHYDKPTSFTTLNNSDILEKLGNKDKLEKIKSKKLKPLVDVDDLTILRGQPKKEYEVF